MTASSQKLLAFLFIVGSCAMTCAAAEPDAKSQRQVIDLWSGAAPGSENWAQKEVEYLNGSGQPMVRNVVKPTLTAYLPPEGKGNGTAIVIAPGGGFRFLSWQSEGTAVAEWLAARGVAAFVLKYRLNDTGTDEQFRQPPATRPRASGTAGAAPARNGPGVVPLAIADGRQAVKVVREHAAEWKINPERIGIMGFSAGGVTAMGVVMNHDDASRPNFAAAIYGGGTSGAAVPADAPPLFILVASDDGASAGSAKLYGEWKAAGKSAELHIYSKGGHGFGMNKRGLPVDHWIERFGEWLEVQGLLKGGN
jgi:acetyl esterase/lipase